MKINDKRLTNPLILIIDDEEAILKTLKDALTDEEYRVETLSDGKKALDTIGKLIPDLLLLDIFMPHCNGLKLLTQIKKEYPDQKVIIISGFGTIPIAIEAVQKGAIDFIEKPLNLDEILSKIVFLKSDDTCKEENINNNNKTCLRESGIVGESNLFLEMIKQIERLAPHDFPILMYGEYGTGKELLARYAHKRSAINNKNFIKINCEGLLEPGAFEKALSSPEKETIFLKHIDSLNKELQKELTCALEDHNKRVIASTHRSLFHLMQSGDFNSSLFQKLNKAPVELPPIRKRPYDIPLLINHYLAHYNRQYIKRVAVSTKSLRLLRNYVWPGNVSQIKHIVERIVINAHEDQNVVTPAHIIETIGTKESEFVEEQSFSQFDSLDQATETFTRKFLLYLLRKNRYSIEQVSHQLNLSPVQLKNKLLELNISGNYHE